MPASSWGDRKLIHRLRTMRSRCCSPGTFGRASAVSVCGQCPGTDTRNRTIQIPESRVRNPELTRGAAEIWRRSGELSVEALSAEYHLCFVPLRSRCGDYRVTMATASDERRAYYRGAT